MPLTDITWTAGDDALGGGPATVEVSPTGSGSLIAFGTPPAPPAPGNFVAVDIGGGGGTDFGYSLSGGLGSVTPADVFGAAISTLDAEINANPPFGPPGFFEVVLTGGLPQGFFTSVTVNGVTLLTAGASSYSSGGGFTNWLWYLTLPYSAAGTYSISFT